MLINISTASPPFKVLQNKAAEELKKRMVGTTSADRLIDIAAHYSGIESRYIVIPDAEAGSQIKFYSDKENYIKPDTKTRMKEYEKWSKELTFKAVEELLSSNKIDPESIERLITISCTGFYAPNYDYYLIEAFNIPRHVKRTHIGFMGCAAALIGFNSAFEASSNLSPGKNILLVTTEICSIHLQTEPTKDNIMANLIFADGAAAALFSNNQVANKGFNILNTASYLFDGSSGSMGWEIGNFGFEMILSSDLPKLILEYAMPRLKSILSGFGLNKEDIKYWALHPGGRAILDSIQKGLDLPDIMMMPSRYVLKNYGNMSSASILFVLKEILNNNTIEKDDLCCAVAFGPGLTMEVTLLKGI